MDAETYIKKDNRPLKADPNRLKLIRDLRVDENIGNFAVIPTAYLEGGAETPLILLHGPGESAVWWLRSLPQLINYFKVIALDLAGHGSSGLPEEKLEMEVILDWLHDLIKKNCSERYG